MSNKTPAVAYIKYKFKTTGRQDFILYIKNTPLKLREIDFVIDIYNGASYKELASKYKISIEAVYKRKRNIFEKLHHYDMIKR